MKQSTYMTTIVWARQRFNAARKPMVIVLGADAVAPPAERELLSD